MPDVFTKAKRSEVMSRIRSRGNKDTELALAKVFRKSGVTGWRRHVQIKIAEGGRRRGRGFKNEDGGWRVEDSGRRSIIDISKYALPRNKAARADARPTVFKVRPDFVFPKIKVAVFVDGCFWHGCPRHATRPKNNRAFWDKKLAGNKARDVLVTKTLRRAGWRVIRIWECGIRDRVPKAIRLKK